MSSKNKEYFDAKQILKNIREFPTRVISNQILDKVCDDEKTFTQKAPIVFTMNEGGGSNLGDCPIKYPLFTEILPDFRLTFCPITADFCKVFQRWGAAAPQPPVSSAYGY